MALLVMAQRAGLEVSAATVDHGLRPEAAGEAEVVARFCAEAGIPHTTLKAEGLDVSGNLAARAREARYRLLADWALGKGLGAVLLGHTLDDQAETVLMRLGRGSGVDGLSAMAMARDWLGVRWLRPMLGVRRAALRDWLRAARIGWVEDPTNDDARYDRVRARSALEVLATLGITAEGLAETATRLGSERAVLEEAADALAARALRRGGLGEVYLDRTALAAALPATARRLVGDVLVRLSGRAYRPRARSLDALLEALTDQGFNGATLAGCLIEASLTEIVFCREPAACPVLPLVTGSQIWDAGWRIEAPSPPQSPLWIGPLGAAGLAEATRLMRLHATPSPRHWRDTPASARRAAPAIFASADAAPATLAAVPSAGLALDPALSTIASVPPQIASKVRHDAPD